jgi:hypothetical protein
MYQHHFHCTQENVSANDNAEHLTVADTYSTMAASQDTCNYNTVAQHATDYSTYPLRYEGGPSTSIFSFVMAKQTTTGAWGSDYPAFPLGTSETSYLSGRTYACPA